MATESVADRKAWLIGGGIASLASAVYLIRDAALPGENITIFEAGERVGGSLDGQGSAERGYVIRGGRMFNFSYRNTYDLLDTIPSLEDEGMSVRDQIEEFNRRVKTHAQARVIANGRPIDVSSMGFSGRDRLDLLRMVVRRESAYEGRRIDDCFEPAFFRTNFWFMWATMFGFQPWHSALEFKRYLHRFVHEFPRIDTLAGVDRTPLNQYDSVVRPIEAWLHKQGVRFELGAIVDDLDFRSAGGQEIVTAIRYRQRGQARTIAVAERDRVFVTNGSMTAASTLGSMSEPARLNRDKPDDWLLWERIARDRPGFGRPQQFDEHIDESYWPSFTVTCREPSFFARMEELSGNVAGTGALVTLRDSKWLLSIVLAHQPHFAGQPPDVQVFWGYGLYPNERGDFVKKRMSDCSGAEILNELLSHLRFTDLLPELLRTATCIPCLMPYITAQFLPRSAGDRPDVVPQKSRNLAFVGQFCELPEDVVFTVEYSVRAARTAVYRLFDVARPIPAIYHGQYDPRVLVEAIRTSFA